VSSSKKHPPKPQASGEVRSLFENCLKLERQRTRRSLDRLNAAFIRNSTFRASVFDAFSTKNNVPVSAESERALKYELLLEIFRNTRNPDERLRILAQWLWAELGQSPEVSLGAEVAARLSSVVKKRLRSFPLNDLYYTQLVLTWLPYTEHLFQDAQRSGSKSDSLEDYEKNAVEIYLSKSWRSRIEFTCEWLAERGGIETLKARKDPDMARRLVNACSRILGRGAPHLLKCDFCGKAAVADFYAKGDGSAFHCAVHRAEQLPTSLSEAWPDHAGRRWWRAGKTIRCELPPAVS
jgi:hypothetical protein